MRRALPRLPILLLLLLLLLLNTTYHKYYFYYCYSLLPTTVNAATTTPTATTKIHCTAYVALDSIFNCYTKWTFSHRNDQRVGPSCGSEVQTEIIPNRRATSGDYGRDEKCNIISVFAESGQWSVGTKVQQTARWVDSFRHCR